jgi:hypothetical protein
MEDISAFLGLLLLNLATGVAGVFFALEPVIRFCWSGYDQWADQHLKFKSNTRRNLRIVIGILALVVASYLAYHDSMNEARRLQIELASLNKSAQLVYIFPGSGGPQLNGKSPGMRLHFINGGSLPSIGLIFEHRYVVVDHQLTDADKHNEMATVKQAADNKRGTLTDSEIQPNVPFSLPADDPDDILMVKKEGSD